MKLYLIIFIVILFKFNSAQAIRVRWQNPCLIASCLAMGLYNLNYNENTQLECRKCAPLQYISILPWLPNKSKVHQVDTFNVLTGTILFNNCFRLLNNSHIAYMYAISSIFPRWHFGVNVVHAHARCACKGGRSGHFVRPRTHNVRAHALRSHQNVIVEK